MYWIPWNHHQYNSKGLENCHSLEKNFYFQEPRTEQRKYRISLKLIDSSRSMGRLQHEELNLGEEPNGGGACPCQLNTHSTTCSPPNITLACARSLLEKILWNYFLFIKAEGNELWALKTLFFIWWTINSSREGLLLPFQNLLWLSQLQLILSTLP